MPHQVVLTLPKRLRPYGLYRRSLLGDLARVAARTVTAAVRATTGEVDFRVGSSPASEPAAPSPTGTPISTSSSPMAGYAPMAPSSDGPAGRAIIRPRSPKPFAAPCSGSSCAAASEEKQAQGLLHWPHSGCHVHTGVGVPEDDRALALRLARYCARNPVALERLTYEAEPDRVTYRSDQPDGPTAGTERVDPLEFLARLVTHIPTPGQVMQRYSGW